VWVRAEREGFDGLSLSGLGLYSIFMVPLSLSLSKAPRDASPTHHTMISPASTLIDCPVIVRA
jgi:hypothetical protein